MSDTGSNKSEASTAVLDVHIGYLRDDVRRLSDEFKAAIDRMATKKDIEELGSRIAGLATREELRAQGERIEGLATRDELLRQGERIAGLETKLKDQSVPSVIERASTWIKNVGGAIGIIGGGVIIIAEIVKRLQ